ncbi:hypothetical protein GOODEAATRI_009913 [Goodea atripinnis]|uniref:Uncharacterized protein n=1 Tax=Goodea atripinnis TaxID=208336 RepID=A0ABV0N9D1_9TELE
MCPQASIYDDTGLYGSGYSSRAHSSSDDDTVSSVSQERYSRGRRDSMLRGLLLGMRIIPLSTQQGEADFSDISESAADYFSRSNRRGSIVSDLDDLSIPDLDSDSLTEVEEKYKKAMVSNAQLDNDKGNLIYQVDTLKDVIEEMEEQMAEMRRELDEKSKKHGLVIIPDGTPNGDVNHEPLPSGITVVTQEAAQVLESAGEGPLGESCLVKLHVSVAQIWEPADHHSDVIFPVDVRLRKLAEEKDELLAQIRKLKNQLEEEKQKHSKVDGTFTDGESMENGTDLHIIEMQSKVISYQTLNNHNDRIMFCILNVIGLFLSSRRCQQAD